MTTYNTGNPLGSSDPRDLYDNAENLDEAVNSEEPQWVDRFGRPRLPLMEQERQFVSDQERREGEFQADQYSREAVFSDFLQASGYQDLGEYAPGIEITAHNQYVTFGGQPYLLKPSVPVPYTTSGEWTGDDFKLIGDDSLRQDLANPEKGAAMVARGVVAVDSIDDLQALPPEQRQLDLRYLAEGQVLSWVGGDDWQVEGGKTGRSITYTVGAGGDFEHINDALIQAGKVGVRWAGGDTVRVNIVLLSGFIMREQVFVSNTDMSYIVIISEDAEVPVSREDMTRKPSPSASHALFYGVNNAKLPRISCLFVMDETGEAEGRHGVHLFGNSSAYISDNCGVKNAGGRGLYVTTGSICYARNSIWDGAGEVCVRASNMGIIHMRGASLKNAVRNGLTSDSAVIHASEIDASGAGEFCARIVRSTVYLQNSTLEDAGLDALVAENAIVTVDRSSFDRAARRGITATVGSVVSGVDAHADDCGSESVSCNSSTVTLLGWSGVRCGINSGSSAHVTGGTLTINGGNISESYSKGLVSTRGGMAFVNEVDASRATDSGVMAFRGGRIHADNLDAQRTPGTPTDSDIQALEGGEIFLRNEVGGTNQTYNVWAPSGIIKKAVRTSYAGLASIPEGSTKVTVVHFISVPVQSRDVSVTPTRLNTASKFWISNVNDTSFDINVDVAGAGTPDTFVWQVNVIR